MKVSRAQAKKALTSLKAFLDSLPDAPMPRKKGRAPMPQRTPKKARPAKVVLAVPPTKMVSINSSEVTQLVRLTNGQLDRWLLDLKIMVGPWIQTSTDRMRLIQGTPVAAFLALGTRKLRTMVGDLELRANSNASITELVAQIQANI